MWSLLVVILSVDAAERNQSERSLSAPLAQQGCERGALLLGDGASGRERESGAEGESRAKSHVVVLEHPEERSSEFTVRASPSRSVVFQHRIDNIVSSRRDNENYCRKCCNEKAHRRCSLLVPSAAVAAAVMPLRRSFSLRCPADRALTRSLVGSASTNRIDFGTIQPALCIYSGARLAHDQRLCLLICMFLVRCLVAGIYSFPETKTNDFFSLSLRKCYYFRLLNYTLEMKTVVKTCKLLITALLCASRGVWLANLCETDSFPPRRKIRVKNVYQLRCAAF